MKYKHIFPAIEIFLVIVLSLQNISSVETGHLRVNVTRERDGDELVFDREVDCVSLNAKCNGISNTGQETTKYKMCDTCKCLSKYSTYFSTKNMCINTNEITTLNNCRIFRQRQTTVLVKSTKAISRPIQAYRCRIKERHPELYSEEENNDTWIEMSDADVSLQRGNRFKNWLVTINNNTISKMLSKYAGRIVKVKLNCVRRRAKTYSDLCIIFKIAGTLIIGARNSQYHHRPSSVYPTRMGTTIFQPHTTDNHNTESANQASKAGKKYHVWIIIAVLIAIVVVLIGVIFCIIVKRKKKRNSNEEHRRGDVNKLQDYDVPTKSLFQDDIHVNIPQTAEDHVYATISEIQNANPPYANPTYCTPNPHYEELNLNDRVKDDVSHYQPLVASELQYVDILPSQAD